MRILGWEKILSHRHTDIELILAIKGNYECFLNGEYVRLNPGGMLLVLPGDEHHENINAEWVGREYLGLNMEFGGGGPPAKLDWIVQPSIENQTLPVVPPEIISLFMELEKRWTMGSTLARWSLEAQSSYLISQIFQCLPSTLWAESFVQENKCPLSYKIENILNQQLNVFLDVSTLANKVGLSERQLRRNCHKLWNLPPMSVQMDYKIRKASTWLTHSDLSIQEISSLLGFQNAFHFSRRFKDNLGTSPNQYRTRGISS